MTGRWSRTGRPTRIAHAVQQSLARLRRETLDVFLLMNPPVEDLDRWRAWETLDALRRAGKVRHIGVSVAEPGGRRLAAAKQPAGGRDRSRLQPLLSGRDAELLPLARRRKVGILAREPLANGFLTGKYAADARFPEGDIRAALPPEYVGGDGGNEPPICISWREGGTRTQAQAALRFVLDDPAVSAGHRRREDAGAGRGERRCRRCPADRRSERERIAELFMEPLRLAEARRRLTPLSRLCEQGPCRRGSSTDTGSLSCTILSGTGRWRARRDGGVSGPEKVKI